MSGGGLYGLKKAYQRGYLHKIAGNRQRNEKKSQKVFAKFANIKK